MSETLVPGGNPAANRATGSPAELAAMDAYAILQHGVSLGTLIARVIHQSTGIDLTPRTVKDPTPGAAVDATTVQIGPGAPRV